MCSSDLGGYIQQLAGAQSEEGKQAGEIVWILHAGDVLHVALQQGAHIVAVPATRPGRRSHQRLGKPAGDHPGGEVLRGRGLRRGGEGGFELAGEPGREKTPGGAVLRSLSGGTLELVYPAAAQTADFGGLPTEFGVRVFQWSDRYGFGRGRDSLLRV